MEQRTADQWAAIKGLVRSYEQRAQHVRAQMTEHVLRGAKHHNRWGDTPMTEDAFDAGVHKFLTAEQPR